MWGERLVHPAMVQTRWTVRIEGIHCEGYTRVVDLIHYRQHYCCTNTRQLSILSFCSTDDLVRRVVHAEHVVAPVIALLIELSDLVIERGDWNP
jgi:hypothetical protein